MNYSCNPFTLQELYLDGCEAVTDNVFECIELTEEELMLQRQWTQLFITKEENKQQETINITSGIAPSSLDPFEFNTLPQQNSLGVAGAENNNFSSE